MTDLTSVLIVTDDAQLRQELDAALSSCEGSIVTHCVDDHRQGVEAARSRYPSVVLVEMDSDIESLCRFAHEVSLASPGSTLAAVLGQGGFGDVAEGTMLIPALRAGVKDFLRRPVSSAELSQFLGRCQRITSTASAAAGKVVSFVSIKGGVGKSTLSVNVATGLAMRHPQRVLLVDASLQMGVCASMLDLQPDAGIMDAVREKSRLDETLLRQLATPHESGLHVLAAPPDAVEAAQIDDEVMTRVLTLARRAYDYVIVDTFPVLDGVVVAVLDLSDRSYVVLENSIPTLLGVSRYLELLEGLGYSRDKQRLTLNRYSRLYGSLRPVEVAQRLGQTLEHVMPYDKHVANSANTGRPFAMQPRRFSRFSRELRQLITDIETMPWHTDHTDSRSEDGSREQVVEIVELLSSRNGEAGR